MANDEHVAAVLGGAETLAAWRKQNPESRLDLSGVDLSGRDLSGLVLAGALLDGAVLRHADLRRADLTGVISHATGSDPDARPSVDLSGARLSNACLESAELPGARLDGADLVGARLADARLMGASMRATNLDVAVLDGARLDHADLRRAQLAGAQCLSSVQLRGACLAGAALPVDIAAFPALDHAGQRIGWARWCGVFLTALGLYVLLVLAGLSEHALVAADGAVVLPLLDVELGVRTWLLAAPVLLLLGFLVCGVALQRVWEVLADLPSVMTDGRPLDAAVRPWLGSAALRLHAPRLAAHRWPFSGLQHGLATLLTYRMPPLVVTTVWWMALGRRDAAMSVALGAIAASMWGISSMLIRTRNDTLAGHDVLCAARNQRPGVALVRRRLARGLAARRDAAVPLVGMEVEGARARPSGEMPPGLSGALVVAAVMFVALLLPSVSLVSVPTVAALQATGQDTPAWLGELMHSDMREASLAGADMRGRHLGMARFADADLTGVNLSDAVLRGADLSRTRLAGADLSGADLLSARLGRADLTDVSLVGADLTDADLRGAILDGTDLTDAVLAGANVSDLDLRGVRGLTAGQLMTAAGWRSVRLPHALALVLDRSFDLGVDAAVAR